MLKLELRKPDAAVREIRETPTFAFSDPCDYVPLSACRNLIRAEHAQFRAAHDTLPVFLNLLSYHFDLRFQRRAVVPNVFGERVQDITLVYSGNYAIISFLDVCEVHTRQLGGREMPDQSKLPNRTQEPRNPMRSSIRFNSASRSREIDYRTRELPPDALTKELCDRFQRLDVRAKNLKRTKDRHRQNNACDSPHPSPKDQREQNNNRVKCE